MIDAPLEGCDVNQVLITFVCFMGILAGVEIVRGCLDNWVVLESLDSFECRNCPKRTEKLRFCTCATGVGSLRTVFGFSRFFWVLRFLTFMKIANLFLEDT